MMKLSYSAFAHIRIANYVIRIANYVDIKRNKLNLQLLQSNIVKKHINERFSTSLW